MSSSSFIYAGVGARQTPTAMLKSMESIGSQLAGRWHLRSGFADGADMAFGRGCESAGGSFEMFLPWEGFNGSPRNDPRFTVPKWTPEILQIAAEAYDARPEIQAGRMATWSQIRDTVKCLMARNVCQVLGMDLKTPADMVICYTPDARSGGGTGQAIRIAKAYNIPVFDIASTDDRHAVCDFVAQKELGLHNDEWRNDAHHGQG